MFILLFILCLNSSVINSIRKCSEETSNVKKFHKIRSCYKSTIPMIAGQFTTDVKECVKFANEKNGLAFNYGPPELINLTRSGLYKNCQILGCPETGTHSSLIADRNYDYYSAFGNFNSTENATCIKSLGLFNVIQEKRNYTEAIHFCQKLGADLADITSESRTYLISILLQSIKGWYKAAYIGMDDIETESVFKTPQGSYLDCSKFRAWSPGHPRRRHKNVDCVILDATKVWKDINCRIKLPFICEFYPEAPDVSQQEPKIEDCTLIKNKLKKKKCVLNKEFAVLYQSSSRVDQCALLIN